jgi:hypothetical protein
VKGILVEVGYYGSIVLLSMGFLMLGWILRELIMPMRPGPTGHYGGDGLLGGLISISLSLYLADVIVGTIFHATGLTERRRSIFHHHRPHRAS